MMKLKNPFTEETRALFLDAQYDCWLCGGNQGVEAHHIFGRVSNSPLNLAPLCRKCHERINHNDVEEKYLLGLTIGYLDRVGYRKTDADYEFLKKVNH